VPRTLLIFCLIAALVQGGCASRRELTARADSSQQETEEHPKPGKRKWVYQEEWWDRHPVLTTAGLALGFTALAAMCGLCAMGGASSPSPFAILDN